tara:strand:- start:6570 stop:7217 length:648 start_codon:yes stop_codon:yes gene_type:complete
MQPGYYLEIDRPLIERIGTWNVNFILLLIYTAFWGWGIAAFILIPANPNRPWPITFAFAFVMTVGLSRILEILVGATLIPGYVYYPVKPTLLFSGADALVLICVVTILAGYIVNTASPTVPLFTTFLMNFVLPVQMYKLAKLTFPNGFTLAAFTGVDDNVPQDDSQLSFPGDKERYDDYDDSYDEYEYGSAPARKLAAILKAHHAREKRAQMIKR